MVLSTLVSAYVSGKYYSVNIPLKDGTTDDSFHALFKPILRKIVECFQPGAIVLQCGKFADLTAAKPFATRGVCSVKKL